MEGEDDLLYMLELCGVLDYIQGQVQRPNPKTNPEEANAWRFNDTYAKMLITNNIEEAEMVHLGQNATSHDMWMNLEAVHDVASVTIWES
jgi:hypothetical protein